MVHFYLDETSGNCMGRSSFAGAHVGLSQNCLMFISTNTECLQAVSRVKPGLYNTVELICVFSPLHGEASSLPDRVLKARCKEILAPNMLIIYTCQKYMNT